LMKKEKPALSPPSAMITPSAPNNLETHRSCVWFWNYLTSFFSTIFGALEAVRPRSFVARNEPHERVTPNFRGKSQAIYRGKSQNSMNQLLQSFV
jgi:hypothetical protein